ncbi:heparinase II/III family protein [Shewanella olleyana]|uniref:heparinase II/III domain-containing protein n=1 Tax=Shewanella olleyana TaxID=135626 RepID=UPI00200E8327|nr:heparinase II/III family protein [Shewanella olleyana]MCL1068148.1 heparinase II/III family protein [Shewanella olleyana]
MTKHYLQLITKAAQFIATIVTLAITFSTHAAITVNHPTLVINQQDVIDMRAAIKTPGAFQQAFNSKKSQVESYIAQAITVPFPADSGGGYTHERHKKNYQQMYDAGILYQLTQDPKYALFVRDMLFEYAELYPQLPRHPKRKNSNEGKLFWQGLNEAMWLVYTIQAYDFIIESLTENERHKIESGVLLPIADFLSFQSPKTFNKVHNHGTWATAAVGMTGFVLDKPELVEIALLDLDKAGKGGFLKQLDELFSPDGYYNEGPYYQRFALLPFVTFAKAIEQNQPEQNIFNYRDGILLKAIYSTIELSYNGLFFPLNDAIKSKGIDTMELVIAVSIAYGLNADDLNSSAINKSDLNSRALNASALNATTLDTKNGLIDIAKQQNRILLTGDGLKLAQAIDAETESTLSHYPFSSRKFRDGKNGDEGALIVMRQQVNPEQAKVNHTRVNQAERSQALVFKATAQGLGHGHFDKLNWQFYDDGSEIVSDYGAARFLNIEAKSGGGYLPENKTWAKQTIAHNTLVVDETSHFNGHTREGNKHHPQINFYHSDSQATLASASIATAYDDVSFSRTLALISVNAHGNEYPLVFDVLDVDSVNPHQYDLPVHYQGQFINANFPRQSFTSQLKPLGKNAGYQHLWLKATSHPQTTENSVNSALQKVTWLNENGHFYTHSSINDGSTQVLFTQLGANDPNNNLRNENSFIQRVINSKQHRFVNVLEPHGEYNPSAEYTLNATSRLQSMTYERQGDISVIGFSLKTQTNATQQFVLAVSHKHANDSLKNNKKNPKNHSITNNFTYLKKPYSFSGRYQLLTITQ